MNYAEDADNKITLSIVVKEKPVDKPTITINNKVNTLALFEDYNLEATVSDKSSVICLQVMKVLLLLQLKVQ